MKITIYLVKTRLFVWISQCQSQMRARNFRSL